jgi:hypothetical protein
MTFSPMPIPSRLTETEIEYLLKLLRLHFAYPLAYPLSGAYFEELFSAAVHGMREKRKRLFDVLRNGTGWSLKTLQWPILAPETSFEVVIQRCDIFRNPGLSLDSPIVALGRQVLHQFNSFCEESAVAQGVSDPRAAFLLRERTGLHFSLFQRRYRLFSADEVEWR